ncbi:MAG: transcription termination factor NusA [Deltaproteobacteria bacterium]|nr:MAG: transcription termination factor NusA [Deltaproteobacteria bacterium]
MLSDLKRIIDQISRDRGFDKALLVKAIEEAVLSATRKKFGNSRDIEVRYNEGLGEIEIFQFRIVVEDVVDEQTEIGIDEARSYDPEVRVGDELGQKMEDVADLGRIAAQSAKQVIIHRMKEAEREVIYDMFKDRVGEVVSGIVQRFDRGNMIVNLGRTEALLPRDQQIPKRSFKQGDRIRAYLKEVRQVNQNGDGQQGGRGRNDRQSGRDFPLVLSRTCDEFLGKLFHLEVPEMSEGIVRVMGVSREPGFRAKIAVSSSESDVDPVGACVGMKGVRVQNVVQELQGERIDIVTWSPDPAKYVYNALAPAHVSMVMADEDEKSLLVVVPNDQLSLAIGRQGQNVRLASKLIGWKIDVKSEQRYANLSLPGYQSLLKLTGVDEGLADQLLGKGITSTAVLARKTVEDLTVLRAIDDEFALALIEEAATIPYDGPVDEENDAAAEAPAEDAALSPDSGEEKEVSGEHLQQDEDAEAVEVSADNGADEQDEQKDADGGE